VKWSTFGFYMRIFGSRKDIEIVEFLKDVPIFTNLSGRVLNLVADKLASLKFNRHEVIIAKDSEPGAMFFIKEGAVQVHDQDFIFATLSKHQYFGEFSLINTARSCATVTALTECQLLKLERKDFDALFDSDSSIARGFLKEFINRLRETNAMEVRLTKRAVEVQNEKLDLMQQRDSLEKERIELVQMNKTKDKFLTIVAHDLKNPFSTILGISELLITDYERYDREQIKTFIEQIHKYSGNAYSLLDNLLQWARSQTGRLKLKPNLFNIKDLVEETVELLQGAANYKNITIVTDTHSLFMELDGNMVSTVIRNLVSNAIKFTPNGGTITISYSDEGEFAHICIVDTGVGISPEDQEKLFRIDVNHTTIGTGEEKGTGLGLLLCREFVKLHKGDIWVESTPGQGSKFHFTLKKHIEP